MSFIFVEVMFFKISENKNSENYPLYGKYSPGIHFFSVILTPAIKRDHRVYKTNT